MFGIFSLLRAYYYLSRCGALIPIIKNTPANMRMFKFSTNILSSKKADIEEISKTINKLGPSYVKLAQFLATRPDIVGEEMSRELSKLQDKMEPFPKEVALAQIANSLGITIDELNNKFESFSDAVGAASIAQVHKAIYKDKQGQTHELAIKVVRPDIKQRFTNDLKSFYGFARISEYFSAQARRLRLHDVIAELERTTKKEMDMRLEAAAISEMHDNTKNEQYFKVANIYWELVGRDVLAMEWLEGTKVSNKAQLIANNIDLKFLANNIIQSFLRHTLYYGFFHADMHPGNLFIDKYGTIIAIDFGITGRLTDKERLLLAQILDGFINRNYTAVAKAHFEAGYVPPYHNIYDFAQANRAIGEPIRQQKAKDLSMANLLGLMFEITNIFDMRTRPELLLLQKSLVLVEGLARDLDPDFNMWESAKPVVEQWLKHKTSPLAFKEALANMQNNLLYIAHDAPQMIEDWRRNHLHYPTSSRYEEQRAGRKKLLAAQAKISKILYYQAILLTIFMIFLYHLYKHHS